MNGCRTFVASAGVLAALVLAGSASAADLRSTVLKRMLADSDMAILGEVIAVDAATMSQVPPDAATVVFRVETVLTKNPAIAVKPGAEVTVAVRDLGLANVGTNATVFADFWMSGDGLAVREVGHEIHRKAPTDADTARLGQEIDAALDDLRLERLRVRIDAADAVGVCTVTAVRDIDVGNDRIRIGPVSEHMPLWREAIVTVDRAIKGATAGDRIVVRFASSIDVAWAASPKLNMGEECVLFLDLDHTAPATATVDQQELPVFVTKRPGSMLPMGDARLVESAAKLPARGR